MKSLLDPSFKYTSSVDTDIRKTFARIRRERARQEARTPPPESSHTPTQNVSPIFRPKVK